MLSGDTARPYLTEGIGEDFLPGTYDPAVVDRWVRVSDRDSFAAARRITREEGILAGESCGTALIATLAVARELIDAGAASGKVIVALFPDGGRNYLSKLYSDEWMRNNGLLRSTTGGVRVADVLHNGHQPSARPPLVVARTTDKVADAIEILERYGISQMPVSERDDDAIEGIVGSISERSLLERAYRKPEVVERTVGEVMDRPLPTVAAGSSVDEAFELLSRGRIGARGGRGRQADRRADQARPARVPGAHGGGVMTLRPEPVIGAGMPPTTFTAIFAQIVMAAAAAVGMIGSGLHMMASGVSLENLSRMFSSEVWADRLRPIGRWPSRWPPCSALSPPSEPIATAKPRRATSV